jgi:hypothetical protein
MKIHLLAAALCVLLSTKDAHAIYENGGFEANNFSSWQVSGGENFGLLGNEPFSGASVAITGVAPGPATIAAAGSDPRAPSLLLPRIGSFTAKVNDEASGFKVTTLAQADLITAADRDPQDNRFHLRFTFAPVLENPSHTPNQQPYFYVRVRNVTDNVTLFEQFAYANQPGVSFQNGTGDWKFLPFQTVDAVLPDSALNKRIETYLVAADCAQGNHGGYVYLDGFGSRTLNVGPPPAIVQAPLLRTYVMFALALFLAVAGGWYLRTQEN